jgi:hypothetical protein
VPAAAISTAPAGSDPTGGVPGSGWNRRPTATTTTRLGAARPLPRPTGGDQAASASTGAAALAPELAAPGAGLTTPPAGLTTRATGLGG